MNLLPWRKKVGAELERADWPSLSMDEFVSFFSVDGQSYPLLGQTYTTKPQEEIGNSFASLMELAYRRNGIVFACVIARMMIFSEARFQWRRFQGGRPGKLFGDPTLAMLETPWPNGTTGDLLARMEQDVSIAGNSFTAWGPKGDRLVRLRPDWTTIVVGIQGNFSVDKLVAGDPRSEVLGYIYKPGGPGSGEDSVPYLTSDVAHYAPIPDPAAFYRGASWMEPVIREIMGDKAMTDHKLKFIEQGATPNVIITTGMTDPDALERWVEKFRENNEGKRNAYKTLFLGAGMTPNSVGANFRQVDFKSVQGAGETRIAAAARIPPIIVGLSEGLEAATYSNYGQARRAFADLTMRPLWRSAAGSLQSLLRVPAGAQLWYDDRDIAFLKEDQKDVAEILQAKSIAIKTLVDSGYEPMDVVNAIESNDLQLLTHTGLVSVQLQKPGGPDTSQNGAGDVVSASPNGDVPATAAALALRHEEA